MKENFERLLREQQAQIEMLKQQLAVRTNVPPAVAPTETATAEQLKELDDKVSSVIEAQKKVRPSEFNPAIGLVGETVFSYSSHGHPAQATPFPVQLPVESRPGGFDVFQRSIELNIAAGGAWYSPFCVS